MIGVKGSFDPEWLACHPEGKEPAISDSDGLGVGVAVAASCVGLTWSSTSGAGVSGTAVSGGELSEVHYVKMVIA